MGKTVRLPTPGVRLTRGVAEVSKGGTGAVDKDGAITNLNGIDIAHLNKTNQVAILKEDRKVYDAQLPELGVLTVRVNGPRELFVGQIAEYTINNFDSMTNYTVALSNGVFVHNYDKITVTAPAYATTTTLTINDKVVNIPVRMPWPNQPVVTGTTSGSAEFAIGIFTSSEFSMVYGTSSHLSSDWQISTSVDFSTIVAESNNDVVNKTTWTNSTLALNTSYYVRVRYRSITNQVSPWSIPFLFTTKSKYVPIVEEAKLTASDRAASDMFGCSVAIDKYGDRVIVGAYQDDYIGGRTNTGSAYVFRRSSTSWIQEAKLTLTSSSQNNDYFGWSVSIDNTGSRVAVGGYRTDAGAGDSGSVVVYIRTNTTWTLEATLKASDRAKDDFFGFSVAIDGLGDRIAVDAPQEDAGGTGNAGSVYVFVRSGSVWTQEAKVFATARISNGYNGFSIDISGDGSRIVSGAHLSNGNGNAYVFVRSGTTWSQEALLVSTDRTTADRYGVAVSISDAGDVAAVGASRSDKNLLDQAGAVYIFRRVGTVWTQEAKLTAEQAYSGSEFGIALSLTHDGSRLLVGSPFSSSSPYSGFGYLFYKHGELWIEEHQYIPSDAQAGDCYGYSVWISGDATRVIMGSYLENPNNISNAGSVYISA